ncbi:Serpin-ZX [Heracleum sosnowskyi]|uniref:Serpin-ZX n=1 Tax=Heracleum sosnowskyi TaxID=360622 RepID=A0AAD8MHC0_9APIA|nr:Serpin-ZX [Heracleum sosnowskyi]
MADVSLTLANHVLLNHGQNSNVVFSPISIETVLSMVAAGSSGATLDQFLSFLKARDLSNLKSRYSSGIRVFDKSSFSGDLSLFFANGVWLDESLSIKPSFLEVAETVYKAVPGQVDFKIQPEAARKLVNSWVEDKTRGLIKDILSPGSIKNDTGLILANALYFKGAWTRVFRAYGGSRAHHDFHLLNGNSIKVPFMTRSGEEYISAYDGFKVLKLPYKKSGHPVCNNPSFSMYIFLPDAKDGLQALVEKAGSESGFLDRHIPREEVCTGKFLIPKFKFEYNIEATQVLKNLGLDLPFNEREAELTEMVVSDPTKYPPQRLYISNIIQKSLIEVDEEGTEAAAATVAVVCRYLTSCQEPIIKTIDFVADHPFLFVIRENSTGIVLFIGQVLNPLTT